MHFMKLLLVLASAVAPSLSRDTTMYSRDFGARLPVEHRTTSSSDTRDTNLSTAPPPPPVATDEQEGPQMEVPTKQPNFGAPQNFGDYPSFQHGFKNSFPRINIGPLFYPNFHRSGYNPFILSGPYDLDFPRSTYPTYFDNGFGLFGPNNYHIRRGYDNSGCRINKDGNSIQSRPVDKDTPPALPREPNFHQRFDPGPDGFGPFGPRPQQNDFRSQGPVVQGPQEVNKESQGSSEHTSRADSTPSLQLRDFNSERSIEVQDTDRSLGQNHNHGQSSPPGGRSIQDIRDNLNRRQSPQDFFRPSSKKYSKDEEGFATDVDLNGEDERGMSIKDRYAGSNVKPGWRPARPRH